jgi:threonylcarbamoyladenosine tRNA methylthiotransferase MtaB
LRRCTFHTFGCKVNQYDTQAIREGVLQAGYREVPAGEEADLHVVNTCTVTAEGDRKARQYIRKIARRDPSARIVVTGCAATRDPDRFRVLPGVHLVVSVAERDRIAEILGAPPSPFRISRFDGHTRAFLKVQDGCDDPCTFCIIPRVRGEVRSRPPREVLEEARRLGGAGHPEIVITGVHLGHYGRGEGYDLPGLIRSLEEAPVERIRLSSLEAVEATDDLLEAIVSGEKVVPHFHLPLQSGADRVLRRMGRPYAAAQFAERADRIREMIPEPAITTDVIVGFPGETDEDFRETVAFCRRLGFSKMHVFPYSEREGTPAMKLGPAIPRDVRKRRGRILGHLGQEMARAFAMGWTGRDVEVLFESYRHGILRGKTERYVPAWAPGGREQKGRIVNGRGIALTPEGLRIGIP